MSNRLRILIDGNIPYGAEVFGGLGPAVEVRTVGGREIDREAVGGVDVLLVRSITRVDEALLAGSPVRFVGTATIGFEHVDVDYLTDRGIAFSSAPGSNANSVARYVASALLLLARREGRPLAGQTVGVVGVGNVGSRVARKCRALGMRVLENDPPRERRGEGPAGGRWASIEEVLAESDVLTLHVPLTEGGPDATRRLAGERFFSTMRRGALFVNTSRGGVHETPALRRALETGRLRGTVLDVWEGEPVIDVELLSMVEIGTPHIAGHSLDGKAAGTAMLYDAVCREFGLAGGWTPADSLPPPEVPRIALACGGRPAEELLGEAALAVYDPSADDARMRRLAELPESERGPYFDRLRREYRLTREFRNTTVELSGAEDGLGERFAELGFVVA